MRFVSDKVISFSLPVRGVDVRFSFRPVSRGGSVYITTDPGEVEALLGSGMYGRVYTAVGLPEKKSEEKKADVPVVVGKDAGVENWQDAAEWLVKNKGVERKFLKTPDAIAAKGREAGVEFSFDWHEEAGVVVGDDAQGEDAARRGLAGEFVSEDVDGVAQP